MSMDTKEINTDKRSGESNFRNEIAQVINRYGRENGSDTPDFILARFLSRCLDAFDETLLMREHWYGRELGVLNEHEVPRFANIQIDGEPTRIMLPVTVETMLRHADVSTEHYIIRHKPSNQQWRDLGDIIPVKDGDQFVTVYTGAATNG